MILPNQKYSPRTLYLYIGCVQEDDGALDGILLLGNMLTVHKNTTCSHYVILGLVKPEPDMSYDT